MPLKISKYGLTIIWTKVPSNKCNFSSSFAQFSSFLYFFLLGGSPVSIKWPSSVLYGNFTFSFTHLSYTKHYKYRNIFYFTSQEWWLSGKILVCRAGGWGSIPRLGIKCFYLSHISIVDISGKISQIPIHKVHLWCHNSISGRLRKMSHWATSKEK